MAYNADVEHFRDVEYPMLKGKTYLDHGGTTLYAKSLIDDFSKKMIENLYGNPHSASSPARLSGDAVDTIRKQALEFFNADPEEFDLIFTANATAASENPRLLFSNIPKPAHLKCSAVITSASIKVVVDSFHDLALTNTASQTFWYGYHKDAHTSLVGIREMTKGTHHCFCSDNEVENWLDNVDFACNRNGTDNTSIPGLFAYPGQSNMTGRRLPLDWAKRLRDSALPCHQNTYSLLDAAALATTCPIDLSDPSSAPDFMAVSFYKIFGFPDLGALIVRRDSGHILRWRRYFGGGTVNMVTVLHEATVLRKDATLHDQLEDGTLPFHNIVALGCAMEVHKKLFVSMKTISDHTTWLAYRLYHGMVNLRHANGTPVCIIYNDIPSRSVYGDPKLQGGTVAFNILRADGSYVGYTDVEKCANEQNIYLRSGGLCNAGGIATYLQIEPWQFKRAWSAGHQCGGEGIDILNGKPTGVVRAGLGAMSTLGDVERLLNFLAAEYVETQAQFTQTKNGQIGNKSRASLPLPSPLLEPNPRRAVSSPNLRKRISRLSMKDFGQFKTVSVTQFLASSPVLQKHQQESWAIAETEKLRQVQVIVREDEGSFEEEKIKPKKLRRFSRYFHRQKEQVV